MKLTGLAGGSLETRWASAEVAVDNVGTSAAVKTWPTGTFVDVCEISTGSHD